MGARPKRTTEDGPVLLVAVSDLHVGSTVSLLPPKVELDDGQTLLPSKLQRWLWQNWCGLWDGVARWRDESHARLVVALLGDIMDAPMHHNTTQSISPHPGTEKVAARTVLEVPKALGVDAWHVIRGTEAHAGRGHSSENAIAEWLDAVKDPDTGQPSTYYREAVIRGVRFDMSHHGRGGYMPWTEGPAAARYAFQVWTEYQMDGSPAPDIILRGHLHRFHDTANLEPSRLIQLPPWQLHTGHGHRLVLTTRRVQIGGALIMLRDGNAEVRPYIRKPQRTKAWTI